MLLRLHEVSKFYAEKSALRSVSLDVSAGAFLGLLGENGAGKSTLLRCLAGLERADRGTILLNGIPLLSGKARKLMSTELRTGVLTPQSFFYPGLSILENLQLYAKLWGLSDVKTRVEELSERLSLVPFLPRQLSECSQGVRRRAALARVFLPRPQLLFLDEPLVNLDSAGVEAVYHLLDESKRNGATVLLATHNVRFIQKIGNTFIRLSGGRVVETGDCTELAVQSVEPWSPE